MNPKENQNKSTDAAWNKLYTRLEQDGLLQGDEQKARPKRAFLRTAGQRWSAVAAVVLICVASALALHKWSPATDMLTLQNDDSATRLVTMLEDGSVVYLSEATSIDYPLHFQSHKREISLQGNAFFEISKNKECPFFIETEDVLIEVLGTAFNVVSDNNKPFSLSVKNGEVKVTLKKTGQNIYVTGGETVLLEAGSLQKSSTTDSDRFGEYTRQIQFKDERLADIIRIINMNSDNIHLELSSELADRRLTVAFLNDTPQQMAELICLALNSTCTANGNTITIGQP